jgi:Fe-S cluster assembly protein SufD
MSKTEFINKIANEFEILSDVLNGQKQSDSFSKRKEALDAFNEVGIPTLKHENWKYTKLAFMHQFDFELSLSGSLSKEELEALVPRFDAYRLVFVNGRFEENLSDVVQEKGLLIRNLADVLADSTISALYSKIADYKKDPFLALNAAMAFEGAYIKVDRNAVIDKPLHIVVINDSKDKSTKAYFRNLIDVAENASVKIIETNHTLGVNASLTNSVSEVFVAQNARAEYHKLQADTEKSYYFGNIQVQQERDSHFKTSVLSLSGKFIRNNINTVLNGTGCQSDMDGFYYVDADNTIDNHTYLDHAMPNCESNEFYKGIMNDKGTGIFNGKIMVRQDAQKTNAYQSNKNILLSDDATINTKPELEIYADDVKCSHGATCGYLDEESLFYLRARGIGEKEARTLLLNAFAGEVIERIGIEDLRNYATELVLNRLSF